MLAARFLDGDHGEILVYFICVHCILHIQNWYVYSIYFLNLQCFSQTSVKVCIKNLFSIGLCLNLGYLIAGLVLFQMY